ncbi:MAG: L-threonylcarbamoyladenylate synthase [Chloroflexota bacterium]
MTARILRDDDGGRAEAIDVLRAGGIVAFPTDTVYGIGVSPATPGGIERLFHVKQRPPDKGIPLLLGSADQVLDVGVPTDASRRLAATFWPGPLTLVLVRLRRTLELEPTIGVRLPNHPCPRALAAALGPLPTTSANLSGGPDALDAATVAATLGDEIDLILDGGRTAGPVASTVVDCTVVPPTVLREGVLGSLRIRDALVAR